MTVDGVPARSAGSNRGSSAAALPVTASAGQGPLPRRRYSIGSGPYLIVEHATWDRARAVGDSPLLRPSDRNVGQVCYLQKWLGSADSVSGGGGNRTRVLERPTGSSTGVAGGKISPRRPPPAEGLFGQPGCDVRRRPPGGATTVSLLTTPDPRTEAFRGGRLPNYLGSERQFRVGTCSVPGDLTRHPGFLGPLPPDGCRPSRSLFTPIFGSQPADRVYGRQVEQPKTHRPRPAPITRRARGSRRRSSTRRRSPRRSAGASSRRSRRPKRRPSC